MQVVSRYASYQMGLKESVKCIYFGFEEHKWKIKLQWVDGEVLFCNKWLKFLAAAKIDPGDVLSIYKTDTAFSYKISVFDKIVVSDESLGGGI